MKKSVLPDSGPAAAAGAAAATAAAGSSQPQDRYLRELILQSENRSNGFA